MEINLPIMYGADISITVFKYIGIWPPESSNVIRAIYSAYSIFMLSIAYVFTTTNVMYLFQNLSMEEFTESFFYVLALVVACCKMTVVCIEHTKLFEITKMLRSNKEYEPRRVYNEFRTQEMYNKVGRYH